LEPKHFKNSYNPNSGDHITAIGLSQQYICLFISSGRNSRIEILDRFRKTDPRSISCDPALGSARYIQIRNSVAIVSFLRDTCYWNLTNDGDTPQKRVLHDFLDSEAYFHQNLSRHFNCYYDQDDHSKGILDTLRQRNSLPASVYTRIDANAQYLILSPEVNEQLFWGSERRTEHMPSKESLIRQFYIFDKLSLKLLRKVIVRIPKDLGVFQNYVIIGTIIILIHTRGVCQIGIFDSSRTLNNILSKNSSSVMLEYYSPEALQTRE
jgi:hypothetical protein